MAPSPWPVCKVWQPLAHLWLQVTKATWNNGNPKPEFNNAAQSWNHEFFWNSMAPNGGGGFHNDPASPLQFSKPQCRVHTQDAECLKAERPGHSMLPLLHKLCQDV